MDERCFACGRKLGRKPVRVDTKDAQTVFVGSECFKFIKRAGDIGWQPPRGGPRLYLLSSQQQIEQAEIDAEICMECGLRFDQHDGREFHRFTNKNV